VMRARTLNQFANPCSSHFGPVDAAETSRDVIFHQQANWCYQLAWQSFDLAVAHKLNLMGNELTAKARKGRQTQRLFDPRSDDTVAR